MNNIKFLLVKGESSIAVGNLNDLRKSYGEIMNQNKNIINLNWHLNPYWIIGAITETTTHQEIIWKKCGERRQEYDSRKIYF